MPGHMVSKSSEKEVEKDIEMLSNLIETHDVIFLVMDSRESRWFPTLAALKFQKVSFFKYWGMKGFAFLWSHKILQ